MTQLSIKPFDLSAEIEALWPELMRAIERVLRSHQFIMGADVVEFEHEVAGYLGAKHAVGVNSGTDALVIALRAAGIDAGDEVITTPFSFFATAESISTIGARPVFVDVAETSFNIDPELIEAAITDRTRAILPVHLFGRPANMDAIDAIASTHGLEIIEDCAQSFGARYNGRQTGTMGLAGAYSFFPTKNLGAYGDGGLIVTDSEEIAESARMLRDHGGRKKYHNEMLGYNSRLDTLQAAILRVKLPHIDEWNQARFAAAVRYNELLENVPGVVVPEPCSGHVFHQYTIRLTAADRDDVQARLKADGIGSMVYYPVPQDRLPVYEGQYPRNPVSDLLARQVLSLPIWPGISPDVQSRVVEGLTGCLVAG